MKRVIESTDLETIKTYLRWQLINSIPGYAMPKAMDAENFDFYSHKMRGTPVQPTRWKRCVAATDGALGEAREGSPGPSEGEVYLASISTVPPWPNIEYETNL